VANGCWLIAAHDFHCLLLLALLLQPLWKHSGATAAAAAAAAVLQVHFYDGSPCWAWLRSLLTVPPAAAANKELAAATTAAAAAAAAAAAPDSLHAEAAAATAALAALLASPQQRQQQQQQQHAYNKRMHSHKPDHRPDVQHSTNQQLPQQQQANIDVGALAEAAAAYSGCLIDTLRYFHPDGTALFADAKRPGQFKQRCLFTVWDPQYTRGNRVDKYGCR
jgi:hypothetical protein